MKCGSNFLFLSSGFSLISSQLSMIGAVISDDYAALAASS